MDVPLDAIFDAFGVAVTVTPSVGDPVETTGAWILPSTESAPSAFAVQRREPREVMALRRDEVGSVPRGTVIDAPPYGSDVSQRWKVDGFDRVEADIVRVVLVPAPDEST